MEFKRNGVIALYLAGKSQPAIVRELKQLNVNKMFVYRTINRYNSTGSVAKRYGGGRKKTATSPEIVRKVKARLKRNPLRSGNQMAKELKISQRSIRRILQNELKKKGGGAVSADKAGNKNKGPADKADKSSGKKGQEQKSGGGGGKKGGKK
ncbi:uncharacterized protein LOC119684620 isoform X1 [Teleopsis dalmanni]|uniref:uncharacterized protein LOC119684620 isoform X1 n=1 Tax=Teleopsis dalmanni TaxID=139649 RepID=UPI0018CFE1E5|nr:uncharacterized protein LOC119684620 isoform X1 [Teleopsis dalmanni]